MAAVLRTQISSITVAQMRPVPMHFAIESELPLLQSADSKKQIECRWKLIEEPCVHRLAQYEPMRFYLPHLKRLRPHRQNFAVFWHPHLPAVAVWFLQRTSVPASVVLPDCQNSGSTNRPLLTAPPF